MKQRIENPAAFPRAIACKGQDSILINTMSEKSNKFVFTKMGPMKGHEMSEFTLCNAFQWMYEVHFTGNVGT